MMLMMMVMLLLRPSGARPRNSRPWPAQRLGAPVHDDEDVHHVPIDAVNDEVEARPGPERSGRPCR